VVECLPSKCEAQSSKPSTTKRKKERAGHTWLCNPSYSEGRDQEDSGSKPAQAKSSQDPISKKTFTKIGLVEWLKVKALSSSSSTAKKKEKEKRKEEGRGQKKGGKGGREEGIFKISNY
jgi:hypothetical protein